MEARASYLLDPKTATDEILLVLMLGVQARGRNAEGFMDVLDSLAGGEVRVCGRWAIRDVDVDWPDDETSELFARRRVI